MSQIEPLCTHSELKACWQKPDTVILDATWLAFRQLGESYAHFVTTHIPGARFFDLEICRKQETDLPNMLPTPEFFADYVQGLGVNRDNTVILYDQVGVYSAPRVWWMFRYFGHDRVRVLDGGLPAFLRAGGVGESGPEPMIERGNFDARPRFELLCSLAGMRERSQQANAAILDCRSPQRFRGTVTETRPGLKNGHIPHSKNWFYENLLATDGMMLSPPALHAQLLALGIDPNRKDIALTCGSGITACIGALALARLGNFSAAVYDGSWAEWGLTEHVQQN